MADTVIIDRDYIDNFSVKDYCENTLIPKYFPEVDVSLRTVGMVGYVTELITNYGEDTFNTGSVLFRETFPNRAQVEESIYSHASIFQLDYVFSTAAECKFLLVLEEQTVINNMINYYDRDTGIYHFYIDKDTKIYVESIPFSLDYDIELSIVKKVSAISEEYIFTAKYMLSEMNNSISDIIDPYVKIRRSADGFMALEVSCHQCERVITEESIINNGTINYPVIDIPYTDDIAGFDILYKAPDAEDYIQMKKLLVYSQPRTDIFCYYQIVNSENLRISFNSKDNYFKPEFNSKLKIIVYNTSAEDGNFDIYTGKNIQIVTSSERWAYPESFIVAAKPIGSSNGGSEQLALEGLQALTVENYRTATALTTENDLLEFFNNYKYRYGDSNVLFIKKRDDIYERVYSSFLIIRDGDNIFKTNTLNMKLNISDFKLVENNTYILEPGWVFTSNTGDGYAHFFRDEEKYNLYYSEYLQAVEDGTIPYITDTSSPIPEYLDRAASYAEFKRRYNLEDRVSIFDFTESDYKKYDSPTDSKFIFTNPFLIYFTKSPNLISTYMTYVRNNSLLDFTSQNEDAFLQFTIYQMNVNRSFSANKKFEINLTVTTNIQLEDNHPVIHTDDKHTKYIFDGKYDVVNNDLRIIMVIKDGLKNVCFIELYPTSFDEDLLAFNFYNEIFTEDYITSTGKLRILSGKVYRNDTTGEYYKVHKDDATLYDLYNKDDEMLSSDIPVDEVTRMYQQGILTIWYNVHNMTADSFIDIPMTDVVCDVYVLYNRYYSEEVGDLVPLTDDMTNNLFVAFDDRYERYMWTNKYSTTSNPITFMMPLNSVRTTLTFEDFTSYEEIEGKKVYDYDIMDVNMRSINFLRGKTVTDTEKLDYFFKAYLSNYNYVVDIINSKLRNSTNVDPKFYNTYGRSRNLVIGEDEERLDTVNIGLEFDIWFVSGTDLLSAVPEVKRYIKSQIEVLNSNGTNNLYISNLMRKIETNFSYVDHMRFKSINNYNSSYQTVKSEVDDISELSVEDRRFYVPELLVCDVEDILIHEYYVQ